MIKFEREDSYLVLKQKDLLVALWSFPESYALILDDIHHKVDEVQRIRGASPLDCVVVEHDWDCYGEVCGLIEKEWEKANAPPPPVDRSQRTMADGGPETEDHRELKENGQQKGYVVLSNEERAKGYVRPVRDSYIHKECGSFTTMSMSIAETYARDPGFYGSTFCHACGNHYPVDQFYWKGTDEDVGS